TLDEWLQAENIPGLEGIDTRTLTIRTREAGTLRAVLCSDGSLEPEAGIARAAKMEWPSDSNLVAQVSTTKKYSHGRKGPRITLFDWGVKQSIISNLAQNCRVTVVPWDTDLAGLEKTKPDLIFMSNGPGDPAHPDMTPVVETVKQALDRWPVVGICLGHQILGLALGGSTYKMRFGHRGSNQPVHDTDADQVFITSQNHGFALGEMPDGIAEVFTNLNDSTCEGIRGPGCWSVQFHPEASPGPLDANVLFDRVREMING
ncbi:MAG: carbamoyl phosphate synthase small subunit, partial [Candidatus Poseidoniia archaeon]|nr:carbamoyl phosphate synthase small subunit [Candidatus Poseidoniia archaeon]